MKSSLLGIGPPTRARRARRRAPRPAPCRPASRASPSAGFGVGKTSTIREAVRRQAGSLGRDRAVDAVDAATFATTCAVGARGASDLVGRQRAGADAAVARAVAARPSPSPPLAWTSGFGRAEVQPGGADRSARASASHGDAGREPAAAHDGLRPARPAPAGLVVGALVRPVEPLPHSTSSTGSSVIATAIEIERDQQPGVAHRAQERQRQRDQGEQRDGDRGAAEHARRAPRSPSPGRSPPRGRGRARAPRASAPRSAVRSRSPPRGRRGR